MSVSTAKAEESKTDFIRSLNNRSINSSSYHLRRTTNFNFVYLLLLLLVISLTNTCSIAQDINTNTVVEEKLKSATAVIDSAQSGLKPVVNIKTKSKTLAGEIRKKTLEYDCPNSELNGFAKVFSIPCKTNADCNFLGSDQRCCKRTCRRGIIAAPKEPEHRAVFGYNRMCPKYPVPELLPVKSCSSDIDCEKEGRVCCPDSDNKLYCRMAAPVWSQLPFPQAHEPLMSLIGYMQCQKAPPQVLDLFPQPCNRTIDCLPNLCCQEGGRKYCRPPKNSVLGLVAQVTQRFARG